MKSKFVYILILFFFSCNQNSSKKKIEFEKEGRIEVVDSSIIINDPILTGDSIFRNKEFINEGSRSFKKFESILKKRNSIFEKWKPDIFQKELKINEKISLKLKRLPYNMNNEIKIMLLTYNENVKVDSILFYQYLWDKDFPDEQRFEVNTYIDNYLVLWNLKSFTTQSEGGLGIDEWKKYKINKNTGKIELIQKIE